MRRLLILLRVKPTRNRQRKECAFLKAKGLRVGHAGKSYRNNCISVTSIHNIFRLKRHTQPADYIRPVGKKWNGGGVFCNKSEKLGDCFCWKSGKWGCFLLKSGKWGVFFCKKWTFHQRTVHCVQYQNFLFYILLFFWGGCVRTQRTPPPAYGPGSE